MFSLFVGNFVCQVLDSQFAGQDWNSQHREGKHLCAKEDTLRESLEQASGRDITRSTEIQYSEKKGWKKMYFELNQKQLICYKDRNNTKVNEWNLSDLTIYLGVERKRKPPTS